MCMCICVLGDSGSNFFVNYQKEIEGKVLKTCEEVNRLFGTIGVN